MTKMRREIPMLINTKLQTIAEKCNTSTSTVSRVLRGLVKNCRDKDLYEKIWAVARELEYSPNMAARELKGEKAPSPMTVDILTARHGNLEEDPFFHELFEIARLECVRRGFLIGDILNVTDIISLTSQGGKSTSHVPYKSSRDVASIESKKQTGLLIFGKCQAELIPILEKRYPYIVGIDRNPTDYIYDEVVCEGIIAAEMAVEHLISKGHREIAYIGDCSYESRYVGYYETLLRHRIGLRNEFVFQTRQTRQEGIEAVGKIMALEVKPSAIFCANDSTAIGVLEALKKNRKKNYNPSVISIDDVREAQYTSPMLTTVALPKEEMVHMAINLLNDRRKKGHHNPVRINLPGKLIERESVGLR